MEEVVGLRPTGAKSKVIRLRPHARDETALTAAGVPSQASH